MNMILTNLGEELASNGFLTGVFPKITKVMFGDGNGVMVTPDKAMIDLVNPIQLGIGTSIARLGNPNRLYIYTQIPSTIGGITIREVGLFTDDNKLIAVGGNFEKVKPPVSESTEKFDLYITLPLSDAQEITVGFSNDNIYADQNAIDVIALQEEANRLSIIKLDNTKAPITSPALLGEPTSPTPPKNDNSTKIATTAFINNLMSQIISVGIVTFDNITNTITFTGLSEDEINNFSMLEIGDVLQFIGATDIKNRSEFTVEIITPKWATGVSITAGQQRKSISTNITYTALTSGTTSGTDVTNDIGVSWEIATSETIIVNQAHANKGTSKNVAARASDTGVTVKLLAKWYNASDGLGQDWVDVTASRNFEILYANNTRRTIKASVVFIITVGNILSFFINGDVVQSESGNSTVEIWQSIGGDIGINSSYGSSVTTGTMASRQKWSERR